MSSTSYSSGQEALAEPKGERSRNLLHRGSMPLSRLLAANQDAAAGGLLALLVVIFAWPLAVQGHLPNSIDFILQYYPNLAFLGSSLRAGELPLWNPLVFAGTPYLADPQSAVLYLPNLPFLLTLDTAGAARAIIVTHYLLATLSAYLYLRVVRFGPAPALVGAVAFGLGDYTFTQVSSMPLLVNLAWVPVALLMLELALRRRSIGYAAATGIALTMQLYNGWLHGLFITGFAVLATLLWHAITGSLAARHWRPALETAGFGALAGVVWAALGAVLLLPILEFVGQSNYVMNRSLEQAGGEGNVTVLALLGIGGTEGHGAYIGMAGLLLVLWGALFPSDRKRAWLYIALGVFSLLTAFGTKAPLYAYLYQWVPGFQIFHTPGRFMVLYILSASALAAFGAEALIRGITKRQGLIAALACLLLIPALYHTMSRMFRPEALGWLVENLVGWSAGPYLAPDVARLVLLAGVGSVVLLTLRGLDRLSGQAAVYAMALLLVLDLFLVRGARGPYFIPPQEVLKPPALATGLEAEADRVSPFRVTGYARNGTFHFLSDFSSNLVPELLPPNLAMVYGLDDVQGYNPLQMRRYTEYLEAVNGGPEDYHWGLVHNLQSSLLDLLNLRYVALRGDESRLEQVTLATAMILETSGRSMTVRPRPLLASSLRMHSYLGHSADMADGEVAARLWVRDSSGREEVFDLRAGIETSEWAYDRPDVLERVKHSRAEVSMTWTLPFTVHTYVADLPLSQPMEVAEITLERIQPDIFIVVPELAATPEQPLARWELAGEFGDTRLYRNNLALPRALLVPQATVLRDPAEVLARLQSSDFDPRREVVLEGPGLPGEQWMDQTAEEAAGDARLIYRTNNSIQLSVQASSYGFLLLNELSYPGWKAYLDGHQVRVWRANYLFRAIEIPPGDHEIEFRFEPDSLQLGLALTSPALALLLAAVVFRLKTRNRCIGRRLTMIDKELLEILACPACKSPVTQEGDWIVCQNSGECGKHYPVRDGIPIMLIDEAVDPHAEKGAES
jgi:uncharacterized protein YbaR (Trm112 family)